MKNRNFLLLALAAAAVICINSASAETISGKVAAVTKNSKSATAEIIPAAQGGQPAGHRYAVSTTFQEITEMLMRAMESKAAVTVESSGNCAATGAVRDCGSIITMDMAKQ